MYCGHVRNEGLDIDNKKCCSYKCWMGCSCLRCNVEKSIVRIISAMDFARKLELDKLRVEIHGENRQR